MLLGSILLALAWAALQGEISPVNLLVGYAVGYAILALLAKGGVMPSTLAVSDRSRAGAGGLFRVGATGRELSRRGGRPARQSHRARRRRRFRWMSPPTARSCCSRMLINITPGSVTIDLSDDRRTLYVHVMHMTERRRDAAGDQGRLRTPRQVAVRIGREDPVAHARIVSQITLGTLGAALLVAFVRLVKGPTLPDRIVAMDLVRDARRRASSSSSRVGAAYVRRSTQPS